MRFKSAWFAAALLAPVTASAQSPGPLERRLAARRAGFAVGPAEPGGEAAALLFGRRRPERTAAAVSLCGTHAERRASLE